MCVFGCESVGQYVCVSMCQYVYVKVRRRGVTHAALFGPEHEAHSSAHLAINIQPSTRTFGYRHLIGRYGRCKAHAVPLAEVGEWGTITKG